MKIKCWKCHSEKIIKNGFVFGWQRYKCKVCGYQFTKNAPSGKPMYLKMLTHLLYTSGVSMRQIARIVGITAQSVSRWINKWHSVYVEEIGKSQILYEVNGCDIFSYLDIQENDRCILMNTTLPSGAKVYTILCLPENKK